MTQFLWNCPDEISEPRRDLPMDPSGQRGTARAPASVRGAAEAGASGEAAVV